MKIYICMKCNKSTKHFYTMGDRLYKSPPNFCQACIMDWGGFLKKFKTKGQYEVDDDVWERALNKFLGKDWRKYTNDYPTVKVIFT